MANDHCLEGPLRWPQSPRSRGPRSSRPGPRSRSPVEYPPLPNADRSSRDRRGCAPDAIHSRTSSTLIRVPLIIGLPPSTAGADTILSNIALPRAELLMTGSYRPCRSSVYDISVPLSNSANRNALRITFWQAGPTAVQWHDRGIGEVADAAGMFFRQERRGRNQTLSRAWMREGPIGRFDAPNGRPGRV